MTEALIAFAVVLGLSAIRVPLAFAMGLVGVGGMIVSVGPNAALAGISHTILQSSMSYALSVLPLFVLMGNFATTAGLSRELYSASYAFIGHRPGGLASATILACAGFGAICGSSVATAATMSKVTMPSMREFGYKDTLATGAIAAGGTLGILIPPSVIMVIYGILTETNIGALFAAGVLPGLLGVVCYIAAVRASVMMDPAAGPPGKRATWAERLRTLRAIWGVLLLFAVVMGGMYGGIFTPTEAAGIGAGGAFLFALARGALSFRTMRDVLQESANTTAMMFTILIGALLFASYINYTGMPADLRDWVEGIGAHPLAVILVMTAIYLVLGCLLESISMILLTVPVFFPLVELLGLDPVWFGIFIVCVVEISLITPPIGMNVFVLAAMLPEVSIRTIFRGVTPFIIADCVRLGILIAFPAIVLVLPKLLFPSP